jgi:hypothetical protein
MKPSTLVAIKTEAFIGVSLQGGSRSRPTALTNGHSQPTPRIDNPRSVIPPTRSQNVTGRVLPVDAPIVHVVERSSSGHQDGVGQEASSDQRRDDPQSLSSSHKVSDLWWSCAPPFARSSNDRRISDRPSG